MDSLPIDPLVPDIADRMRRGRAVVLEAPPGAGKTTRVPRGLLDAGLLEAGEVLVLEPRRLAARMAARRVAAELGEQPGETVGYQVRFEDVSSKRTRIRFMTEGILTRRLLTDPKLAGVSAVLLDEFHERHLHGDVGLALLQRLRKTSRPDLRLAVMSATLDAAPIAAWLSDADEVRSEGRQYEVAIDYLDRPSQKQLPEQVAAAVSRMITAGLNGDVLVFLPGADEIRRSIDACRSLGGEHKLMLLPLHGDLSPDEQDRAVRKWPQRKIIFATNVAETSVTIDGVIAVIDSGLARMARHSPWSGLATLKVAPVSKASATQRAGRAGRTRAGNCLRLYTRDDFNARPDHDDPEIRRADLAQMALEMRAAGLDPRDLSWLDDPPSANLTAAENLLHALGATDRSGAATDLGRKMARLPLHPRLARVALEAASRGAAREGALLAAILGERDLRAGSFDARRAASTTVQSDAVENVELFLEAADRNLSDDAIRSIGLDGRAVRSVDRARKQIERSLATTVRLGTWKETERVLRMAILAGYPDRVAARRPGNTARPDFVFAGGGSGQLSEMSGVRDAPLVVVVDAEERRGVSIRSASAIDPDWLIEFAGDALSESVDVQWNSSLERAEAISRMRLGAVVLDESRAENADPDLLSAKLLEAARASGPRGWSDAEEIGRIIQRIDFVGGGGGKLLDEVLVEACKGRRSFDELREAATPHLLKAAAGDLDRLAPDSMVLPGGRRLTIHYEEQKPPWVESRMQDFFGMANGPALAGGRALTMHLLAPNQRPVQVTQDLAGFWERHYPAIRRELMRRYPRHSWPENPLTALPPVRK